MSGKSVLDLLPLIEAVEVKLVAGEGLIRVESQVEVIPQKECHVLWLLVLVDEMDVFLDDCGEERGPIGGIHLVEVFLDSLDSLVLLFDFVVDDRLQPELELTYSLIT